MTFRDRLGLSASPLILRVVLGVTFLWSGLGKAIDSFEATGPHAALLRSMGVAPATPRDPGTPAPAAEPPAFDGPEAPLPPPPEDAGSPPLASRAQAAPDPSNDESPIRVPNAMRIALLVHQAANPGTDEHGVALRPLAPAWAATGRNPVLIAWSVTATEVAAGSFLIIGLVTRLSALSAALVMTAAAWITQLGPALQSGATRWGVLPAHAPFDAEAWTPLLMQFTLGGAAIALAFAGPGSLSLDRLILGRSRDAD